MIYKDEEHPNLMNEMDKDLIIALLKIFFFVSINFFFILSPRLVFIKTTYAITASNIIILWELILIKGSVNDWRL